MGREPGQGWRRKGGYCCYCSVDTVVTAVTVTVVTVTVDTVVTVTVVTFVTAASVLEMPVCECVVYQECSLRLGYCI